MDRNYCIVPWVNGLLQANSSVVPCCYAPVIFGDWQENDLEKVWHSDEAVQLRSDIANGRFINKICASCYRENRSHTPTKLLALPYNTYARPVMAKYPALIGAITKLKDIFGERVATDSINTSLSDLVRQILEVLETETDSDMRLYIQKLQVLATLCLTS